MQKEYESPRSRTPLGSGRSRPLPSAVALLCLFTSTSVAALGLGAAEVASSLNQPLDVRIPLHDVGPGGAGAIEVGLASRARLRDAGLDGARYLDRLRFRVEAGAAGGHYVRVTSEGPIAEPFLRFLLRVDGGQGRVIREYTLLLDPPALAMGDAPAAAADSPSPVFAADTRRARAEAGPPRPRTWGPVARGSSAWEVAAAVGADDASIYQTMVALLRANPGAFRDGNLGGLKAGVRLTLPSAADVRAIPQAEAVAVYREHLGAAAGAGAAEVADTGDAAGPVAVRPLPDISPIRTAGAAQQQDGGAASSGAAGDAGTGPRLPVRLDDRLGGLVGAVDAVEARVAAEGDSISRALSSQSGQLDRVEGLVRGVRQEVAALREAQPAAASTTAAAGGLSYRTGVLLALGGLLLGGLAGYAAGRGLPARARTGADEASEAPEASEASEAPAAPAAPAAAAHGPFGHDDAPLPAAASQQHAEERSAVPDTAEQPAVTADAAEAESMDIAELEWDQAEGTDGPSGSEDDHLFWADIYIAENLPREAEKIIRDAIGLYGERPGYRVKLLEALYSAGAREQYLREATRYRAAAIDEGTWDEVVRMGRTLAPDHPPFGGAAAMTGSGDDTGAGGRDRAPVDDPGAGVDPGVPAAPVGDEHVAPDLSELDEAIGDDDAGPEGGVLLWDEGGASDPDDAEAAAELDFDPLDADPERSSRDPGSGRTQADPAGSDDDDAGEDDDYREAAGRR